MARRRINNSKRRKEWRKARAEELAELRALWMDASRTYRKWTWHLISDFTDTKRQSTFFYRLYSRLQRRRNNYQAAVDKR